MFIFKHEISHALSTTLTTRTHRPCLHWYCLFLKNHTIFFFFCLFLFTSLFRLSTVILTCVHCFFFFDFGRYIGLSSQYIYIYYFYSRSVDWIIIVVLSPKWNISKIKRETDNANNYHKYANNLHLICCSSVAIFISSIFKWLCRSVAIIFECCIHTVPIILILYWKLYIYIENVTIWPRPSGLCARALTRFTCSCCNKFNTYHLKLSQYSMFMFQHFDFSSD